jgi:hypothetical protein
MMYWLFCKYIRKQIAEGHTDELMLELVRASKEIWYEDNVYTVQDCLSNHLDNALSYEYQTMGVKYASRQIRG